MYIELSRSLFEVLIGTLYFCSSIFHCASLLFLQLYRSAELAECTDLCICEASLQVSCKVACVPRAPCSSRLAHYSHSAPAYQAYRGRCYCYSGSFICMRPNPSKYQIIITHNISTPNWVGLSDPVRCKVADFEQNVDTEHSSFRYNIHIGS